MTTPETTPPDPPVGFPADAAPALQRGARGVRPLRPALRARRLRRGVRRAASGREAARSSSDGARRPLQPRAPWRLRRRGRLRRRRRHPRSRSPTRSCATAGRASRCPAAAPTPSASRSSRRRHRGRRGDGARRHASPPRRGCDVLGWRDAAHRPAPWARPRAQRDAAASVSCSSTTPARRDRHRPRAHGVLPAQAGRAEARGAACTSRRCRRARSSTRACSPPPSSTTFFPDLRRRARSPSALALVHRRFSTNTFPSWPLAHPYRLHRPQRRDQHGARATATGCAPARRMLRQRPDPRRPGRGCSRSARPGVSDSASLRRGARAAAPRRPAAAARGADDDPRGVGEPRRRWTRPRARVLRVPRRRSWSRGTAPPSSPSPTARSSARCSTATACARPLLGHRRRPGRARQRGRRARRRPGARRAQGPAAARPDVPRRHRAGPHRRRRGDQGAAGRRSTPTTSGCTPGIIHLDELPEREHVVHTPRVGAASPADLRLHRGGAARSCSRRWRATAPSRSARWAPTRPSRCSPSARGCCSTTSPSCSRRSPTRRSTRSARSSSPRCRRHIGPEGNLLDARRRALPQVVLPFPVIDNDELAKIRHIDADGDLPGFAARDASRGLYEVAGGGAALRGALDADLRTRSSRRDRRRASASSCCPTATPTPSSRRSRRCC